MRFSLWCGVSRPWEALVADATRAETMGWDGVWLPDHFLEVDGSAGRPECLAQLAALAVAVPRVRLGSLVCAITYRHPGVLASQAVTVDRISGGRFVLGLGAGWQANEHHAYGIPMPDVTVRLDMLDEAAQVVRGLLAGERVTFSGEHYQLDDALALTPAQSRVPLLIGGGGERRTLRSVAQWADEWNTWGGPEVLAHKGAVLDRHCEDVDRDPAEIHRSAQMAVYLDREPDPTIRFPAVSGSPAQLQELMQGYADAGVGEFVVRDETFGPRGPARDDLLDRFLVEVAAPFRE